MAAEKSTRAGKRKKEAPAPRTRTAPVSRSAGPAQAFDAARKLPQSPEAEVALLGSLLFDPTVMAVIVDTVKPDDFYVTANRVVAQVIWDLWNDNEPIDPAIIYNELCKRKQDTVVGGHEGLMRLADAVPEASHAAHYARIVKDKGVLRNLITACQEAIADACDATEEADAIVDRSERKVYEVAHQSSVATVFQIGPVLHEVMKAIDDMPHQRLVTGLATGYYELDELTSGFQKGEMIVLASRPSMGKTTLALNIAEHVALEEKAAVAIFSLETSVERIARNMLCAHAGINAHLLRTGRLDVKEYSKINIAVGTLSEAKIYVDDTTMLTSFQLKAKARRLKARHDISFVIVDYLQLLDSPKAENRQQEISAISRQFKALAKELDLPVLVISQLSRAVEAREGNRPRLSDLRESGAIEQDADVVMMLYRSDYYQSDESKHTNIAELIIAKQRNGPTGTVKLQFAKQYLRFGSLSLDKHPEYHEKETAAFEA
jgi:replicative DNA helicase